MKSSLTYHAAWSLAALAAFAAGYRLAGTGGLGRDSDPAQARMGQGVESLRADSPLGRAPGDSAGKGGETAGPPAATLTARVWTPEEVDSLAKAALTDPNPLNRHAAFAKLLASMTPENAEIMLAAMKSNRSGGEQMGLFLYAWGSMDATGVLAHAETLTGWQKERFLQQALPGWASKDPRAAIAWLDKMEEGDLKNRHRGSIVGGLADHDIGLAADYVIARAAAGDGQAGNLMETVAGEAIRKNGALGAVAWAERLPEGAVKGEALDRAAEAYAQLDPAAAAAWAARMAAADYGPRIIEEVGDAWAQRDPKAAIAWLGTLSEGAGRSEGTYSALREWTRRDAMAASQYLSGLPASPSKDSAVSGFARSLAREDPESAIIWARTIADETSRVQTLTRAGQSWFRRDPAAASNWVQSSGLPPAAQQAVLNPPRDYRRRD